MSTAAAARKKEAPLPSNNDAERAVLGAIIMDNSALAKALEHIKPSDFFQFRHQRIFQRMIAMADAGKAIDLITLCEEMAQNKELDAVGDANVHGSAYIASLFDGMPRVQNIEHYAKIIKEHAVRRQVITLAEKIQARAWEGEETPVGLITSAQQSLASITPQSQTIVGGNGKLSYSLDEFLAQKFPPPEHLIEWTFSKSGSALIVAKPHHLKSWYTLAVSLLSTVPGTLLNKLHVPRPVRTLLVSVEDFPGQTQERIEFLLKREGFRHIDRDLFRIIPRPIGGIDIMSEVWYQRILRAIDDHKADIVIFDVLRRITSIDINSPKESSLFCEQMERLRDTTGASTVIVHHENRKEADIMAASAGSFNIPGWANSVIRFQRKLDEVINESKVSSVEIEVDNKFAPSPEPVRMVLDLSSETPIRLEELEDATGLADLREQLGLFWTVNDLSDVLGVHKSNAKRRLKKMIAAGIAEKAMDGKRGRSGGLARYQFVGAE